MCQIKKEDAQITKKLQNWVEININKARNDVWDQASKIQDRNRNDADEMAMESAKTTSTIKLQDEVVTSKKYCGYCVFFML